MRAAKRCCRETTASAPLCQGSTRPTLKRMALKGLTTYTFFLTFCTTTFFRLSCGSPPPAGSLIKLDAYVQVVNTGGGLRLRYEPGLLSEVNYLAVDYEVFVVEDGPREADGMTWWFLVAQADDRRNGWAASNYLQVVR